MFIMMSRTERHLIEVFRNQEMECQEIVTFLLFCVKIFSN